MENIENFLKDLMINFNKLIGFKEGIENNKPTEEINKLTKQIQYYDTLINQAENKKKETKNPKVIVEAISAIQTFNRLKANLEAKRAKAVRAKAVQAKAVQAAQDKATQVAQATQALLDKAGQTAQVLQAKTGQAKATKAAQSVQAAQAALFEKVNAAKTEKDANQDINKIEKIFDDLIDKAEREKEEAENQNNPIKKIQATRSIQTLKLAKANAIAKPAKAAETEEIVEAVIDRKIEPRMSHLSKDIKNYFKNTGESVRKFADELKDEYSETSEQIKGIKDTMEDKEKEMSVMKENIKKIDDKYTMKDKTTKDIASNSKKIETIEDKINTLSKTVVGIKKDIQAKNLSSIEKIMKGFGNKINSVVGASTETTKTAFKNIENMDNIENSRTRAEEILNNPTKFNNFTSFLENHIYANSKNSKQVRLLQASELLTQKDTIASNIIMDYLYKNEKGTNVHKIYDRIDQLNDDKARKIEINTYYNKAYKEYINILKVIILVCIIIVPIIIANKNNMIPNSVTMFLVVAIIFLTVIFIIYKFSDIYMRDNKNFDKLRIAYDREAALLEKQGTLTKKKNPLTSLTLTCIGQDCCDGSMVYDFAKNKCILSENFGGYFESMNNYNNGKTSYVEALDGTINESFANCNVKQNLVANSLNCSEKDKFYSNDCSRRIEFNF